MNRTTWWVVLVLVVGASVGAFYYWLKREQQVVAPPPVAETQPAPQASAEPEIHHPIEPTQPPGEPQAPLPALDASDAAIWEGLVGALGRKSLDAFFQPERVIRRIVVTIDNLPRKKVAQRLMPVKPTPGPFAVAGEGDGAVIAPDNSARYTPFVRLAEAVDTKKLVAVYVHFYPLFQKAYEELGYPGRYFNDRLVEVIDHLLAAREVPGPVKLVRPKVMYEFADPELEALSAGQKIMIRMGSENAVRVKSRLREIRQEVVGRAPPRS